MRKWENLHVQERNLVTIVSLVLIAGFLALLAAAIFTPNFVINIISEDDTLSPKGVDRLNLYRQLSIVGGFLFVILSIVAYIILLKEKSRKTIYGRWLSSYSINPHRLNNSFILLGMFVFSFFFLEFLYYIIADANWVFGDQSRYWDSVLIGKLPPLAIFVSSMRFTPFSNIELSIFKDLGNVPYLYYSLQMIQFIVLVLSLYFIIKFINNEENAIAPYNKVFAFLVLSFFICLPNLYDVYSNIIFTEDAILTYLSLFILFYLVGIKKDTWIYYGLSLIFLNLSLYQKEPVFGVALIIALVPLIMNFRTLTKSQKRYMVSIIGSSVLFILMFIVFVIIPYRKAGYNGSYVTLRGEEFNLSFFVKELIQSRQILLFPAIVLSGYRLLKTINSLLHNKYEVPMHYIMDGFLYSGVAYFFAHYLLKLSAAYYFVPTHLLLVVPFYYYSLQIILSFKGDFVIMRKKVTSSTIKGLTLVFFVAIIFLYFLPMIEVQRDVNKMRREHFPSIEKIMPEIEESLILFMTPGDNAFSSEFHRDAIFPWRMHVTRSMMNYIAGKELNYIYYEPLGEKTDVPGRINSLDEIDSNQSIIIITMNSLNMDDLLEISPELESFNLMEGIKIPVIFLSNR